MKNNSKNKSNNKMIVITPVVSIDRNYTQTVPAKLHTTATSISADERSSNHGPFFRNESRTSDVWHWCKNNICSTIKCFERPTRNNNIFMKMI